MGGILVKLKEKQGGSALAIESSIIEVGVDEILLGLVDPFSFRSCAV
jgi:hypothetical protein